MYNTMCKITLPEEECTCMHWYENISNEYPKIILFQAFACPFLELIFSE